MTVACIAAAVAVVTAADALGVRGVAGAVFGGMVGPLVAVGTTWVIVARTQAERPAAVHGVMLAAFIVKVVFFSVYAVAMVTVFNLDVGAFGLSFAAFFIALYAIEAAFFARLFRGPARGTR
jgi:hypothetical protein